MVFQCPDVADLRRFMGLGNGLNSVSFHAYRLDNNAEKIQKEYQSVMY